MKISSTELSAEIGAIIAPRLGMTVREKHTGIEGEVVAITQWLHRSTEVAVLREGVNHDGAPWSREEWFDAARLSVVPDKMP